MDLGKRMLKLTGIVSVMLIAVMLLSANSVFAGSGEWGKTTHVGKYYLKYNNYAKTVYVSKKKSSGFRKTPVDDRLFVSNGKQIIYVSDSKDVYTIKSYDIARKKVKKLKKLPDAELWEISGVKGNYLWVEKTAGNRTDLYKYNIQKKSLKLFKKGAYLYHLKGEYYMYSYGNSKDYRLRDIYGSYDMESVKTVICTLSTSGKPKTVKKLGYVCDVDDHYLYAEENWGDIDTLYFSKNKSHDLYRVKYNGTKMKKVKSFSTQVYVINKKSCELSSHKGYKKYKY